jgi:hypothetical protein
LHICILPTWADKITPDWGIGLVIFTPNNAEVYGRRLAHRRQSRANLIWCLGGDRPPTKSQNDWRPIWRGVARGIRSVLSSTALLTYHPDGGYESPATIHAEGWSDFIMIQSGHWDRETPGWGWVNDLYNLSPAKPVWMPNPTTKTTPPRPGPPGTLPMAVSAIMKFASKPAAPYSPEEPVSPTAIIPSGSPTQNGSRPSIARNSPGVKP